MATTTIQQKIQALKKKISAKNARINKLMSRISESKSEIKSAKKEIGDMEIEIKQLELEQLSDTLFQNGITTADVAAAIAAGEIKKSQSPQSDSSEFNQDGSKNVNITEINDNMPEKGYLLHNTKG